jgi:hypothetical protein
MYNQYNHNVIVYSQLYNVVLLSLQVQLNQLIVVLQPWLLWICGSYCE